MVGNNLMMVDPIRGREGEGEGGVSEGEREGRDQ